MNRHSGNLINVIATGFIVTVLFSLLLFWGRLFCYRRLFEIMPDECRKVTISPSELVPGEVYPQMKSYGRFSEERLNEPNSQLSEVSAWVDRYDYGFEAMGIIRSFSPYIFGPLQDREGIYYSYINKDNYLYFDNRSGLFNYSRTNKEVKPSGDIVIEQSRFFAGPNGVSETAAPALGRFKKPLVSEWNILRICLYEVQQRTFYLVDFNNATVTKGIELAKDDRRQPAAMGWIGKGIVMEVSWRSPKVKDANGSWIDQKFSFPGVNEPNEEWDSRSYISHRYTPVLDKSGRIYLLDTDKWSLTDAGFLPVPQSWVTSVQQENIAKPRGLLAYRVMPVYAILRLPADPNKPSQNFDVKYLGMSVACVSREGTSMVVAVFDPNGRAIKRADTESKGWSSAGAIYGEPWNSFWAPVEYILENLQPPVLEVASYLSGDYFEASAGHRALFILPNSFLGMLGRAGAEKFLGKQFLALASMGPSLILLVWLTWKVRKDAILVGLSREARMWWTAGTIAFGLPAYITYRLTRHREVLVTCQNCGMLRRPDMETCHRCGSKWVMPDLTPPSWRISD